MQYQIKSFRLRLKWNYSNLSLSPVDICENKFNELILQTKFNSIQFITIKSHWNANDWIWGLCRFLFFKRMKRVNLLSYNLFTLSRSAIAECIYYVFCTNNRVLFFCFNIFHSIHRIFFWFITCKMNETK